MPGVPPTTPHYALPRYSQNDPATFASEVNAVSDQVDAVIAGVPISAQLPYGGSGDPTDERFLLAEGRLIDRTVHAAFFTAVGHKYNGGVDPGSNMVRIPDKRGRVSVGADNMGTAQGAANRIPNSSRAAGQNGGEERHVLLTAESPAHTHTDGTLVVAAHSHGPGTLAVASHTHSASGLSTAAAGDHNHGPGIGAGYDFVVIQHGYDIGVVSVPGGATSAVALGSPSIADVTAESGTTGTTGSHVHTVQGSTGGASPAVTGGQTASVSPDVTGATGSTGGGGAHNNMQPYEVDNWIVRVA